MAQTGQRVDPFRNFNFLIELDGHRPGQLHRVQRARLDDRGDREPRGRRQHTVRKLPGKTTYGDITLKWGLTTSTELWDWRQQIIDGNVVRKNGSIVVFDLANSTEVARWNFLRAWPTKWEGPAFNAKGNDIAIDTLVLAPRRADPGMTGRAAGHGGASSSCRRGTSTPTGNLHRTGDDAAGDGGGRDLPAEGSAGAELARLPDRHPAVPGGHQARQR